jgi:acetyltransferase-like isoleucine patch superfamily enzyme
VGSNFRFGYASNLEVPKSFTIGDDFFCGPYAYFSSNAKTKVTIGNSVMFGPQCMVIAGNHNISDLNMTMMNAPKLFDMDDGIIIEDDVWVGARAVILDGSHISEGTVVAAGAVISCKTKPYSIYGGVPAKFIKHRFTKEEVSQLNSQRYKIDELLGMYEKS